MKIGDLLNQKRISLKKMNDLAASADIDSFLKKRGFSPQEIEEVRSMLEYILDYVSARESKINWKAVASMNAERLRLEGSTQKVKDFAKEIRDKLEQFS